MVHVQKIQSLVEKGPVVLDIADLDGDHFGPVSLQLHARERLWLSGPSGSGKSRFLRAVADLDPSSGVVCVDGKLRHETSPERWRRLVALLPAESHWWAETVGEHFPIDDGYRLQMLGFDFTVLDWSVSRLSSGERQRLALLRLLTTRPRVLLLDEPTANLDRENTLRVEALIADYVDQNHSCALWVSHDREQAERIGDRIAHFANGRFVTN